MFRVSKKKTKTTRTTCQIYSKLTIDSKAASGPYFTLYSTNNIAEFEQMNSGWA